jgi:hypothetical protein
VPIDDPKDITMQDLLESELTGNPVRARHLQGSVDSIEEHGDGQGNLTFFDGPRFVDDYSRISPIVIDEPSKASVMAAIALMRRESELGRLPVIVIDSVSTTANIEMISRLPPLDPTLLCDGPPRLTVLKNRDGSVGTGPKLSTKELLERFWLGAHRPAVSALALQTADCALRDAIAEDREAPDDWGTVPLREDKNGFHVPCEPRLPLLDPDEEENAMMARPWAGIGEMAIGLILAAGLRISIGAEQR